MEEMLRMTKERLLAGEDLVWVTALENRGSVPGKAGARMLAGKGGRVCGTIGGGRLEYEALLEAKRVIRERKSGLKRVSLSDAEAGGPGMVCGGELLLYFLYLDAGEKENLEKAGRGLSLLAERKPAWLSLEPDGHGEWRITEENPLPSGERGLWRKDAAVRFAWPLLEPGRVYLFGGGHVARETIPLLAHVGFRCTVLDDRPEYAAPGRFPEAEEVLLVDFARIADSVAIGPKDFVIIMTRGHESDMIVQEQALRTQARYIGVMGSRRKKEFIRNALGEKGFSGEDLDRIHTPIGLPIGAKTPAEIAVSIAAELIQKRSERGSL